jgi:AraC family transcriptional regulator, regulatory protein of adaptative response / methylated-DNA-[protein]-cysteine methyltransferase
MPTIPTTTNHDNTYACVAGAIEFIIAHAPVQPTLAQIAAHSGLSPFHFQRLFSQWVGVTPKRFLQVLTVEHAKELLRTSQPLLAVADTLGLSSSSRLHDHFVTLEAVTPGEFRQHGAGLTIEFGVHNSPFGRVFIALTPRGICNLSFVDTHADDEHLAALAQKWPGATLRENKPHTQALIAHIFDIAPQRPLSLHVTGTNFQVNVWRALLQIAPGALTSYSQIAHAIGNPRAVRAVGSAVGANPISFLIPCHRVLQQSGKIGGYHWGETRKHAMHAWECARHD